jgi:hypothetical protein
VSYLLLVSAVGLAGFVAASTLGSVVAIIVWRRLERDLDRCPARARELSLLLLRLFPTMAGAVVVLGVVVPAFHRFEPRAGVDELGPALGLLAALGAALLVDGLRRGVLAHLRTRGVVKRWLWVARPLAAAGSGVRAYRLPDSIPIVSLAGIVRPRVFISAAVLNACPPDQVAAILAHEVSHHRALDNAKRLLISALPDVLLYLPAGRALEAAWVRAAEEAADAAATAGGRTSSLDLADALIAVARLVPVATPRGTVVSMLQASDDVERRVRRLVFGARGQTSQPAGAVAALAVLPLGLTLAVGTDATHLWRAYEWIERLITVLP